MPLLLQTIHPILLTRLLKSSFALQTFICIVGLIFIAQSASAQVTVNATLGTNTATYTTVNAAFTAINAGTHKGVINILITGNTTEPAPAVPLLKSGGSADYTAITIKPSGGNFIINSAATPSSSRGILELAGADNVTIDGDDPATAGSHNLSIINATSTSSGISVIRLSSNATDGTDGCNNITLKNLTLKGSRSVGTSTVSNYGIIFTNGITASTGGSYAHNNITIDNNIISRAYYGIYANGASSTAAYYNAGIVIKNNKIGSDIVNENIGQYGIYLNYSSTASAPALISNNDISGGDLTGTSGYSASVVGIYLSAGCKNAVIERNHIHDIRQVSTSGYAAHGIAITSSTNSDSIMIKNNIIRDLIACMYTESYTSQYANFGIYVSSSVVGLNIMHNTIYLRNSNINGSYTNTYTSAAININASSAKLNKVCNNILINTQGSSNALCFILNSATNIVDATLNNNIYYTTSNTGYYNALQASLINWKIGTGKDVNSEFELPTFTSATNLRIPNNTATVAESGGMPTSFTQILNDIDNVTRPGANTNGFGTKPDIGANEFDGILSYSCVVPPNPGNTLSTKNNLCFGESVTLSVQNNQTGTGLSQIWQYSLDGINYTDINAAITNTYSEVPATSKYYRLKVTCLTGNSIAYSTPIHIVFANNVITQNSVQRCGTGIVNLSATANPANGNIFWYDNTGNNLLATGNTYTPLVVANTTFKVKSASVAATNIRIGDGVNAMSATSYPNPFSAHFGGVKHQIVFTAQELAQKGLAAGNITAIAFDFTAFVANKTCNDLTIRIGHTSATSLTGFVAATTTTVYNSIYTPNATGLINFIFSTPFNWNGTDNIIIETIHNAGNSGNGSGTRVAYTPTTANMVYYHAIDGATPATSVGFEAYVLANPTSGTKGTSLNRPNVVFAGQGNCFSGEETVNVMLNTAPLFDISSDITSCNNAIKSIAVTSPATNYNMVTWSPVTNLYTDAAATIPYVANTHASQLYYKSNVGSITKYFASAFNSTTNCGSIDSIEIKNLPATIAAVGNKSYVCGSGSALFTLSQDLSSYGLTYQWQSSPDNINFVNINAANAINYTTPVITSTTYYRVLIINGADTCLIAGSDTLNVENPAIINTTSASRCGDGTLTLSANAGNYVVDWFTAATGGSSIHTGNSFTTPVLNATTNYYVQARSANIAKINVASPNIGTSTFITATTGWGLRFTVNTPITISSVKVKAINTVAATASLQIKVTDLNDVVLYTGVAHTFPITATLAEYVIPVDIFIPNSGNYKMQMTYANISNMVRESSGMTFPYNSPNNEVSITAGANGAGAAQTTAAYYWFYNWVLGADCNSTPRVAVNATVNANPVVSLDKTGNVGICSGGNITLTAGGGTSYTWIKDNQVIAGSGSTLNVTALGAYKVVAHNAAGCTDTSAVANVVLSTYPIVNLGNDTSVCADNSIELDAKNATYSFLWNNNATTQKVNVSQPGTYYVKVTNLDQCSSYDTIVVGHYALPLINIPNDTAICEGDQLTLNAFNNNATYVWNTGSTNASILVNDSGDYKVTVTSNHGCIAQDSVRIDKNALPIVNLGPDQGLCIGNSLTISAGNPGNTYLWNDNTTTMLKTIWNGGTYYVKVTDGNTCANTDTIIITQYSLPIVNLGKDTAICANTPLIIDALNAGSTYNWNTGATSQTIAVDSSNTYYVKVTDQFGCINYDTIHVISTPDPTTEGFTFIPKFFEQIGKVSFNPIMPKNVIAYHWDFGDTATSLQVTPTHLYKNSGSYDVMLTVTNACGSNVYKQQIKIDLTNIDRIDMTDLNVLIYPNPANTNIQIELKNADVKIKSIEILNAIGQKVGIMQNVNAATASYHVDKLASGIYYLQIMTDQGNVVRKFEVIK